MSSRVLPIRLTRVFADAESTRYGLQLAVAAILAYLASLALHLPEGLWAVMSALVIVRPRTGSTVGEGWDRVKGAALGAVCGLAGVYLYHLGLAMPVATLAVVAGLAFVSGILPGWRSAPITALIILASGGLAGHSAWLVAGLRLAEIVVGVGAGVGVMLCTSAARSAAHFEHDAGDLLLHIAEYTRLALQPGALAASDKEAWRRQMQIQLRRLAILAASAETEQRWLPAWRKAPRQRPAYSRRAQLIMRLNQDAGLFSRIFESMPERQGDVLWVEISAAVCGALQWGMAACAPDGAALPQLLERLQSVTCLSDADEMGSLLAAPARLLAEDLRLLARLK